MRGSSRTIENGGRRMRMLELWRAIDATPLWIEIAAAVVGMLASYWRGRCAGRRRSGRGSDGG